MSSITLAQGPSEIKDVNPAQDLQKSTSLHGRAFHKIIEGGKDVVQSINKVAQSILSTCIYVVSFGSYNLDNLKSYFFSNQTALKGGHTDSSSNLPMRSAPPPPPMPTSDDLNRASSSRSSSAETQELPSQNSIVSETLNGSSNVRSSTNSTWDFLQENDNILGDITNSRRSSLDEDANRVSGQENSEPKHEEVKKAKNPRAAFMDFSKESIQNALKNLRPKKKVAQE